MLSGGGCGGCWAEGTIAGKVACCCNDEGGETDDEDSADWVGEGTEVGAGPAEFGGRGEEDGEFRGALVRPPLEPREDGRSFLG